MAREVAGSRVTRMSSSRTLIAETPAPGQAQSAENGRAVGRSNFMRPLVLVPHRLTPQERHRRISELAFRRAEQRGFAPGNEFEDWLEAEREVDAGRY